MKYAFYPGQLIELSGQVVKWCPSIPGLDHLAVRELALGASIEPAIPHPFVSNKHGAQGHGSCFVHRAVTLSRFCSTLRRIRSGSTPCRPAQDRDGGLCDGNTDSPAGPAGDRGGAEAPC